MNASRLADRNAPVAAVEIKKEKYDIPASFCWQGFFCHIT